MKSKSSKSLKKYEMAGTVSSGPGKKTKKTSPGGAYVTKTQYDDKGQKLKETERRTLKGFFMGAPKAQGVTYQRYKSGGSVGKSKKK